MVVRACARYRERSGSWDCPAELRPRDRVRQIRLLLSVVSPWGGKGDMCGKNLRLFHMLISKWDLCREDPVS